jgi:cystathionine beta-lyase
MQAPEATYLGWINIEDLELDDPEAFFLEAGVGISPGQQFMGEGYIRLNFGCPKSLLNQGLDRIEKACRF